MMTSDGLWGVNIDQISQVLWEFCGIPRDVPGQVEHIFDFSAWDMTIAGTLSDLTIDRYMWGYDMISHIVPMT